MEIKYINKISSTQKELIQLLKNNSLKLPICIYTYNQYKGIGSRNNSWLGTRGNIFFSFAIPKNHLPNDIKPQSYSIYFGYIFKLTLSYYGSKAILKWPNDIYLSKKKIGGVITYIKNNTIVCGIGLNIKKVSDDFGILDVELKDKKKIIEKFFYFLEKYPAWSEIFDNIKDDFEKYKYLFYYNNKIPLKNAILQNDGSIKINQNIFYGH